MSRTEGRLSVDRRGRSDGADGTGQDQSHKFATSHGRIVGPPQIERLKFNHVGTKLPLEKTLEEVTIRGDEIFEPGFPTWLPDGVNIGACRALVQDGREGPRGMSASLIGR